MKKLTKKQIAAARALITNKDGSINRVNGTAALLSASSILAGRNQHYRRPGGPGKRSTVDQSVVKGAELVEALGYTVKHGNSAPRGGELGDLYYKVGRPVLDGGLDGARKLAAALALELDI